MYYRSLLLFASLGLVFLLLGRSQPVRQLRALAYWLTEPVMAAESQVTRRTINLFSLIASIKDLHQDNSHLQRINGELMVQLSQLKEVEHENKILRQELNFIKASDDQLIPAQLIGRTAGGAIKDLIINQGSQAGIKPGQAVIAQGYLIGLVSDLNARQATVTLLTHPRSVVPVLLQESRATGLLHGGIGGLTLTDLLIDSPARVGETVLTSGLGAELPAGLPIGTIANIISRPGDITKKATISSPVDIPKLEIIFISKRP